jgi:hypothetical protein
MLIGFMVLAILLAGHISAWPWLGLLLGYTCRSFTGSYSGSRLDTGSSTLAGPHIFRRRGKSSGTKRDSAENMIAS